MQKVIKEQWLLYKVYFCSNQGSPNKDNVKSKALQPGYGTLIKEKYNHRASRAGIQNLLQSYQKGSHHGF